MWKYQAIMICVIARVHTILSSVLDNKLQCVKVQVHNIVLRATLPLLTMAISMYHQGLPLCIYLHSQYGRTLIGRVCKSTLLCLVTLDLPM